MPPQQVPLQQASPQAGPQAADAEPDTDAFATLERWRALAMQPDQLAQAQTRAEGWVAATHGANP